MNINTKGTYVIEEDHYEKSKSKWCLSINYSYYFNTGTYEQPPEEDMEIESVELNGMDITDFFWEFVEAKVYQQVIEYAREQ
jgi:hypothetical protein|tara:strand:+ start:287 stop:532 length:246 start_codon:yes stop_codon:yes gene_type:complete